MFSKFIIYLIGDLHHRGTDNSITYFIALLQHLAHRVFLKTFVLDMHYRFMYRRVELLALSAYLGHSEIF